MKQKVLSIVLTCILAATMFVLGGCGEKTNAAPPQDDPTSSQDITERIDTPPATGTDSGSSTQDPPKTSAADYSGVIHLEDNKGYTYDVQYEITNPVGSIDTTKGEPGKVQVDVETPVVKATIINTTSGKEAPALRFLLTPYYTAEELSAIGVRGRTLTLNDLAGEFEVVEKHVYGVYIGTFISGRDRPDPLGVGQSKVAEVGIPDIDIDLRLVLLESDAQRAIDILSNPSGYILYGTSSSVIPDETLFLSGGQRSLGILEESSIAKYNVFCVIN
jgi:hypothetical protein